MILKCLDTKNVIIVTTIVSKHVLAYGTVVTSSVAIVVSCTKNTKFATMNERSNVHIAKHVRQVALLFELLVVLVYFFYEKFDHLEPLLDVCVVWMLQMQLL